MQEPHYYDVNITWDKDRIGTMKSSVLDTTWEVATPPEFPKGVPNIWSPEHLFVGAVNSCLMTTFLAIAENSKLDFVSFNSEANGKLDQVDGKFIISEITLIPLVIVKQELDIEKALRILEKAERACLISNSIKSTILFQPKVEVS
jgi:peroxiredoxin-like protein